MSAGAATRGTRFAAADSRSVAFRLRSPLRTVQVTLYRDGRAACRAAGRRIVAASKEAERFWHVDDPRPGARPVGSLPVPLRRLCRALWRARRGFAGRDCGLVLVWADGEPAGRVDSIRAVAFWSWA